MERPVRQGGETDNPQLDPDRISLRNGYFDFTLGGLNHLKLGIFRELRIFPFHSCNMEEHFRPWTVARIVAFVPFFILRP